MRVRLSVSVLWMKSAWPAPAGHHSTRQWLTRSVMVLPPSGLSRMKEFSPVIRTAFGSTGGGIGGLPFEFCVRGRGAARYIQPPTEDTGEARWEQGAAHAAHPPQETAMSTRYLHLVRMDVAHDHEKIFNDIYDHEHVPALLAVPGVVKATRHRSPSPTDPRYIAAYEIESPAVLQSPEWKVAAESGRWPKEVRPHTMNRHIATYQWAGSNAALTYRTPYIFWVLMDVERHKEDLFNELYDSEHVPLLPCRLGGRGLGRGCDRALDPHRHPYLDDPDRQRGHPGPDPHPHRVRPGGGDARAPVERQVRARARLVERDHRRPVARPAVRALDPADAGGRPGHPDDGGGRARELRRAVLPAQELPARPPGPGAAAAHLPGRARAEDVRAGGRGGRRRPAQLDPALGRAVVTEPCRGRGQARRPEPRRRGRRRVRADLRHRRARAG